MDFQFVEIQWRQGEGSSGDEKHSFLSFLSDALDVLVDLNPDILGIIKSRPCSKSSFPQISSALCPFSAMVTSIQHFPNQLSNLQFIVHKIFAERGGANPVIQVRVWFDVLFIGCRKANIGFCALIGRGDLDAPSVPLNNVVTDAQSKPCTFTHGLGREEELEVVEGRHWEFRGPYPEHE